MVLNVDVYIYDIMVIIVHFLMKLKTKTFYFTTCVSVYLLNCSCFLVLQACGLILLFVLLPGCGAFSQFTVVQSITLYTNEAQHRKLQKKCDSNSLLTTTV